jgi:hypothetical protein
MNNLNSEIVDYHMINFEMNDKYSYHKCFDKDRRKEKESKVDTWEKDYKEAVE